MLPRKACSEQPAAVRQWSILSRSTSKFGDSQPHVKLPALNSTGGWQCSMEDFTHAHAEVELAHCLQNALTVSPTQRLLHKIIAIQWNLTETETLPHLLEIAAARGTPRNTFGDHVSVIAIMLLSLHVELSPSHENQLDKVCPGIDQSLVFHDRVVILCRAQWLQFGVKRNRCREVICAANILSSPSPFQRRSWSFWLMCLLKLSIFQKFQGINFSILLWENCSKPFKFLKPASSTSVRCTSKKYHA